MGLAQGYSLQRVRAFWRSLDSTSGPLGSQLEMVVIGDVRNTSEWTQAGATLLTRADLASAEYLGLLGMPRWKDLREAILCGSSHPPKTASAPRGYQRGMRFNCSLDILTHGEELLTNWETHYFLVTARFIYYTLVLINRLELGPVPHLVVVSDMRDAWFQRDVRDFLRKDQLWAQWRANTAVSAWHRDYAWQEAPGILFVAQEGCQARTNKNGKWLNACFGRGVTADSGLHPGYAHSYCSGTIVGTAKGALVALSWMTQLISRAGQCRCNTEQQFWTLLVHNVFTQRKTCLDGVDDWPRQLVPRVCPSSFNQLDRIYVEHFIGGDIMTMSCLAVDAVGTLPGRSRRLVHQTHQHCLQSHPASPTPHAPL